LFLDFNSTSVTGNFNNIPMSFYEQLPDLSRIIRHTIPRLNLPL